MPTPLLATPKAESSAVCKTCSATLIRTGKPATHVNAPATIFGGKNGGRIRAWKGWVPALLVDICPVCDSFEGTPINEDAPLALDQPVSVEKSNESYLERLGREHDERENKEGTDAAAG